MRFYLLLGALSASCLLTPFSSCSAPSTVRVSVATDATQANNASYRPSISADGRYIAFRSDATNLVPNDSNGASDAFVRDLVAGTTQRVSVASDGTESNGQVGYVGPVISGDGRYVVFWSNATNLVSGVCSGRWTVFERDTVAHTTRCVSVNACGSDRVAGGWGGLAVSPDGRYIAFATDAWSLYVQVYVCDMATGGIALASAASAGGIGNFDSGMDGGLAMSNDGRFVAFESNASDLVPGTNQWPQPGVYVRDMLTNTTECVSVRPDGTEGNGQSGAYNVSSSGDGRYVSFVSSSDLTQGSPDRYQIYVRDRMASTTRCVSVTPNDTPGNGYSGFYYQSDGIGISCDGRYETFASASSDLVAGDNNGHVDTFVRDVVMGLTQRVSLEANGEQGNGDSSRATISADGRYVAFASEASNLVSGDTNNATDIFVRGPLFDKPESSPSWHLVAKTGPSARISPVMAYDSARGRTVLFGGYTWNQDPNVGYYGDTWEWDGFAWKQVATMGPPPRSNALMVFDSVKGKSVLFGGYCYAPPPGCGVYFTDTWEWDGSTWTQLATSGPSPRYGATMAFDSARGKAILFGGRTCGPWLDDMWEWDGSAWTQINGAGPHYVEGAAMIFDTFRGKTVLFGGFSGYDGLLGDTSEWDGTSWMRVSSSGPSPRSYASMAYDSARFKTVLFGGQWSPGEDTWEWDGMSWTPNPCAGPGSRADAAMAFDSGRSQTVLFGGQNGWILGDTWEYGTGGPLVSGISRFDIAPSVVDATTSQISFRVEPMPGATFQSVRVAGKPECFSGAPPGVALIQANGIWTGSLPLSALSTKSSNPVTFVATAARPDGTTASATAPINVNGSAGMDIRMSTATARPLPGQTVSVSVVLNMPDVSGLENPTVTVTLPPDVVYVGSIGLQKVDNSPSLTWQGAPSPLPGLTAGQTVMAFEVQIPPDAAKGAIYQFSATAAAGWRAASVSTRVRVSDQAPPRTVTEDDNGGFGFLTGGIEWVSDDNRIPVEARGRPEVVLTSWLFGDRRPDLWLGIHNYTAIGDATVEPGPDLVGGLLAKGYLISPDTSPQYAMTFGSLNGEVDVDVGFTWESMGLVVLDGLLQYFIPEGKPKVDTATIVQVSSDFLSLSSVHKAMMHFDPPPKSWAGRGQAAAAAIWDLAHVTPTEAQGIVSIIKEATGLDVPLSKVVSALGDTLKRADLLLKVADMTSIVIGTRNQPMEVRFVPGP